MLVKKVLLGLAIVVGLVGAAKAYTYSKKSTEEKVRSITNAMADRLSLTEAQKEQVYNINMARSIGHQKAFEAGRDKQIIEEAVKEWKTSLKKVLTPEQSKKLKL